MADFSMGYSNTISAYRQYKTVQMWNVFHGDFCEACMSPFRLLLPDWFYGHI